MKKYLHLGIATILYACMIPASHARDGLTMPEFAQTITPAFERADVNKDGILTGNEVDQFYIYAAQISPAPPLRFGLPNYQCMHELQMPGVPVQPATTLSAKDVNDAMQTNFMLMDRNKDFVLHLDEVTQYQENAKADCDKLRAAMNPDNLTPEQRQQMQMILKMQQDQLNQHL